MQKAKIFFHLPVIVIMVIMTWSTANINFEKDYFKNVFLPDGKGYYAYLPAIFIYKDLSFSFLGEEQPQYYSENIYHDYLSGTDKKGFNKFAIGTPLCQLPFFFMAHSLNSILGKETKGFSKMYGVFVCLAALFYCFIGLLYLNLTLKEYNISAWKRIFVLFAAVFGTNLFYYAIGEPAMSHVYSFGFISMFIYFSKKYFSSFERKYLPILGLVFGVILLIRSINGLVIFALPFIAGNFDALRKGVIEAFKNYSHLATAFILMLLVYSIQLIIYKVCTGSFLIDPYGGEVFFFNDPHIIDILFSYKKGLFLYTPLYLLSFAGLWYVWKTSKFANLSWFGFFLLITYIFSCWWCWYYGGSFSSRVYVEYIPLFMILLAIALESNKNKALKIVYPTLIVLIIALCQIQTYQKRYSQIHWSEMTKERYWEVFLRIDEIPER